MYHRFKIGLHNRGSFILQWSFTKLLHHTTSD
nr:MAG TPA: hypothetical protein [Caudoviricetes sp.]